MTSGIKLDFLNKFHVKPVKATTGFILKKLNFTPTVPNVYANQANETQDDPLDV